MLITNILAALPGEPDFRKVDVLVESGRIAEIAAAGSRKADDELDGSGLMMFPGAIDPHVHFDEPGFTHREDFAHGSSEAARGGVTTVIDMPCTSLPPVTSPEVLENKLGIVSGKSVVDFAFFGGIPGQTAAKDIGEAVRSLAPSVVGFKCYTVSGMESFAAVSPEQFGEGIKACASVSRPLLLHAEDPEVIGKSAGELAARRGSKVPGWVDYYASRPMEAETTACEKALRIAGANVKWLHIVHVGTARAAEMAARGGASCETCAHYLAFDEDDFARLGAALKTAPPVKDAAQKALLWKLLAGGAVDFVASDHAGAPGYEKFSGSPLDSYGGIPGTGTLFPYLLSEGLFARRLSLTRFIDATSGAAARRYGIWQGKGSLQPGKDADFVLVDPDRTSVLDSDSMLSKNCITPFEGMRLAGAIVATYVRGNCVFGSAGMTGREGPQSLRSLGAGGPGAILTRPGTGKFITWGYK